MGKSISVRLTNGSSWPTKSEALKYFKSILGSLEVGQRVQDEQEHEDLLALVQAYDAMVVPGAATKIGCGVAYFEKGVNLDHPGKTKCFFLVRRDGSRIDFGLGHAIDAAAAA